METRRSKRNLTKEEVGEKRSRRDGDDSEDFVSEDSDVSSVYSGDDASSEEGQTDLESTSEEDSDEDWVSEQRSPTTPRVRNANKGEATARGQGSRGGRGGAWNSRGQASFSEKSWNDTGVQDITPPQPIFRPQRPPGPQITSTTSYTPLQLFQLFFTNSTLQTITQNTNEFAAKNTSTPAVPWVDVSLKEMLGFMALTVYMGFVKCSSFLDYWKKPKLYRLPFPKSVMTCRRFCQICRALHLSSMAEDAANDQKRGTPAYDRLGKIQPFYAELRDACRNNYHPTQNISVDERMVKPKSHISLKQYMKSKPVRWGYKMFALADASSGYTWDFFVYEGKSHKRSGKGTGYDSVMQLVNTELLGTGYKLFVDSFYTSSVLFRDLLQKKIWACGTIKAYRAGCVDSNLPRGGIKWRRKDAILFVQWKDTRDVFLCSTLHTAHGGDTVQQRVRSADGQWTQKDIPVPPAVEDYNRCTGGVDLSDVLIGNYKVLHRAKRWYRTFFYHFMDIAIMNAFILHKELARSKGDVPWNQKAFRETLALELADVGSTITTDEPASPPPRPSHHRLVHISGHSTFGRLRCRRCQAKTPVKCGGCNVPLCFLPSRDCYNDWHKENSQ